MLIIEAPMLAMVKGAMRSYRLMSSAHLRGCRGTFFLRGGGGGGAAGTYRLTEATWSPQQLRHIKRVTIVFVHRGPP